MKTKIMAVLAGVFLFNAALCAQAPSVPANMKDGEVQKLPFSAPRKLTPGAPNVLMIGDSILGGYIKQTGRHFQGKINLYARASARSVLHKSILADLETALTAATEAGVVFDVIHFNEAGLHALGDKGVPTADYLAALERYVATLRRFAPQARLVWASTTPLTVEGHPEQLDPVLNPLVVERNEAAKRWFAKQGVAVNDLYAVIVPHLELGMGDRFHWTPEGKDIMAQAVCAALEKVLAEPRPTP